MNGDTIDTYPIPLNGLRHFYWAAKLTSFKKAAEALNISEAAISQQIRNLESTLNVKLFNRGHQKVTLTRKGARLYPFVQTAFINLHEGVNSLIADPEPNRLSISTMPSFATNWLIKRLGDFNLLHPKLSISIDTSIELLDFETHQLDLAIRYGSGNYSGVKSELLMSDPTVLVCRSDLVTNGKISRDDFKRLPLIVGTTNGVQKVLQRYREFYNLDNESQNETLLLGDGSLGVDAVRAGQGISLQRLGLVIDLIESGELVYATDYAYNQFSFYAVAPESHFKNPKITKFLKWLRSEMKTTEQLIAPHFAKIKSFK